MARSMKYTQPLHHYFYLLKTLAWAQPDSAHQSLYSQDHCGSTLPPHDKGVLL